MLAPSLPNSLHSKIFYRSADRRSHAMADRFLRTRTSPIGVLVAGGFHTQLLADIFAQQGVDTAVLQPKISKIDPSSDTDYLSIFCARTIATGATA